MITRRFRISRLKVLRETIRFDRITISSSSMLRVYKLMSKNAEHGSQQTSQIRTILNSRSMRTTGKCRKTKIRAKRLIRCI